MMEALIQKQQDLITLIEQVNSNFKKDPNDRKTREYIAKRLERLDNLWSDFQMNHDQLLTFSDKSHEYFTRDMLKQVKEYYVGTRDLIANFFSKELISDAKNIHISEINTSTSMWK